MASLYRKLLGGTEVQTTGASTPSGDNPPLTDNVVISGSGQIVGLPEGESTKAEGDSNIFNITGFRILSQSPLVAQT